MHKPKAECVTRGEQMNKKGILIAVFISSVLITTYVFPYVFFLWIFVALGFSRHKPM